ncbi:hypothetical protein pb186bvf_001137 [Paramecium bursaria]
MYRQTPGRYSGVPSSPGASRQQLFIPNSPQAYYPQSPVSVRAPSKVMPFQMPNSAKSFTQQRPLSSRGYAYPYRYNSNTISSPQIFANPQQLFPSSPVKFQPQPQRPNPIQTAFPSQKPITPVPLKPQPQQQKQQPQPQPQPQQKPQQQQVHHKTQPPNNQVDMIKSLEKENQDLRSKLQAYQGEHQKLKEREKELEDRFKELQDQEQQ